MSARAAGGGVLLREARLRLGVSQAGLARESGVSERTIRGLENGQIRSPHTSTLLALAAVLDLPGDRLEAFLRSWTGWGVLRSYGDAMATDVQTPHRAMREGLVRSFVDKRVVAATRLIRVGADRLIHSERYQNTIEALRDDVDSHLVVARGRTPREDVRAIRFDELDGCAVRSRTVDREANMLAVELALGERLGTGQLKTFAWSEINGWAERGREDGRRERVGPDTRYVNRFLRPISHLALLVVFEDAAPRRVTSRTGTGAASRSEELTLDEFGTASAVWQNAGPGRYGIEWEWT